MGRARGRRGARKRPSGIRKAFRLFGGATTERVQPHRPLRPPPRVLRRRLRRRLRRATSARPPPAAPPPAPRRLRLRLRLRLRRRLRRRLQRRLRRLRLGASASGAASLSPASAVPPLPKAGQLPSLLGRAGSRRTAFSMLFAVRSEAARLSQSGSEAPPAASRSGASCRCVHGLVQKQVPVVSDAPRAKQTSACSRRCQTAARRRRLCRRSSFLLSFLGPTLPWLDRSSPCPGAARSNARRKSANAQASTHDS